MASTWIAIQFCGTCSSAEDIDNRKAGTWEDFWGKTDTNIKSKKLEVKIFQTPYPKNIIFPHVLSAWQKIPALFPDFQIPPTCRFTHFFFYVVVGIECRDDY